MNKYLFFLTFIFFIGCTSINQWAGMGVIKERVDNFDGARIVEVSPNFVSKPGGGSSASFKLGAHWKSTKPDTLTMIVNYAGSTRYTSHVYTSFESVSFNVDGEKMHFEIFDNDHTRESYNSISNDISTDSFGYFEMKIDTLKLLLAGEDVRMRVTTTDGYDDSDFDQRTLFGADMAASSLEQFLSRL